MFVENENITESVTETETEVETTVESFGGSDYDNSELETSVNVLELNEYVSVIADNTTEIKQQTQVEIVLIFAVICVIGVVCGLLGALTWRSNKNG